ncbi:MAG: FixH family protein [Nitrospirota bacterium]
MKQYLSISALVFAAFVAAACGASKPAAETKAQPGKMIASQKSGDLVINLENEKGELAQGQNRFIVSFRSANGEPVDAGKVTVSSSMAMPGMAPMVAPIELQSAGQTGMYSLTGDFAMSGAWKFEIRWDGPAGQGTTSFSANVR